MSRVDYNPAAALNSVFDKEERLAKLIRWATILSMPVAVSAGATLYVLDRSLLDEVVAFLWRAREALFVLAVSLAGAGIIGSQIKKLRRESMRSVKETETAIARAMGHIQGMSGQSVNEISTAMRQMQHTSVESVSAINQAMGQMLEATETLTTMSSRSALLQSRGAIEPQFGDATQQLRDTPKPPGEKEDYWDDLSDAWRDAKQSIEDKISSIEDQRRFEKYSKMKRYDYSPIVESLVKDRYLGTGALGHFEEMKQEFNNYRPQVYVVPKDVWQKFQRDLAAFKTMLRQGR